MLATSPVLQTLRPSFDADSSTPVAVLQRQFNTVDEAVRSIKATRTRWQSSRAVVTLRCTVLANLCVQVSSIHWFHIRISVVAAYPVRAEMSRHDKLACRRPFELTHVLILRSSTSTRHSCISYNVYTSLGTSALTEKEITLTLLVTQETYCRTYVYALNYWR